MQLNRDISKTNVLIAAAGGMIGSGWLFSPFISAQIAGGNALMSWIIAALFMALIALPLCELGAMLPIAGGITNYPTFTHGTDVGFLFAWTSWLSYVVMVPIEIQAILQYSSHFFPNLILSDGYVLQLSGLGYLVAMSIMVFVVILNTFGIKHLANYNKYASLLKFILPFIAIAALISVAPSFTHATMNLKTGQSWEAIFSALSTGGVVFAFTGFQNGLMLAGEVKNPQRNIPIAILGAVGIGFTLYFLLQFSFLVAMPDAYLTHGWSQLQFPGDGGPLVGLTLLLGLGWVATLLLIDAVISPFGTTLVYTAVTARIVYAMALNQYLPKLFTKLNTHRIPYVCLLVNLCVGCFAFFPFPGWQKMVAFLSSCSILTYGIGPICLLGMRQLQPGMKRPFYLMGSQFFCYAAFYVANLMLYWCGFEILWKLNLALLIGFIIHLICNFYIKKKNKQVHKVYVHSLCWFASYMLILLGLSYLGSFGGLGMITFPMDALLFFPFSAMVLYTSQKVLCFDAEYQDEIYKLTV